MTAEVFLPMSPQPSPVSVMQWYQPHFAPPQAAVAIAAIADPFSGVALIVLGSGRCAPAAMKSATSAARVLLSPFYSLGDAAAALGNVAICVLVAAAHYATLRIVHQGQRRRDVHHHNVTTKQRKKMWNEALSRCRFPNATILVILHLSKGVAFFGGQSFITANGDDTPNAATSDSPLMAIFAAVVSMLLIGCVITAVVISEIRGVASVLSFQRYRLAALHRLRWVPVWVLPLGQWEPADVRRQLGALRGPVAGGSERFAMLTAGVGVAGALLVGAVPGSVGGCVAQAAGQCVLLLSASLCVAARRPMRVPLTGWLLVATWVVQACLNVSMAVGRVWDSESALNATVVFTLLHTVLGALKALHGLVVAHWERKVHPKHDMVTQTDNHCGQHTMNATMAQLGSNSPPHYNPKKRRHRVSPQLTDGTASVHTDDRTEALRYLVELCCTSPSKWQSACQL